MGMMANLVSVILKSVTGDKIGNGLIKDILDISIDGISKKGIKEITDFINEGRFKIENTLSRENIESMNIPENHTDYVVAEIKDLFSKIYITDEVLGRCRYSSMDLSVYLWNKYREYKNDNVEYESDIKRCIFAVAETLIILVHESENFEKNVLKYISNSVDDANIGLKKLSAYVQHNFDKLDANGQIVIQILQMILQHIQEDRGSGITQEIKFQNNKKQKYIKSWNSRLFLHIDNDENPITLEKAFIAPDFKYHIKKKRMKFLDNYSLTHTIKMFIEYHKSSNLLITGVPGIGKTSIISWIANKYKDNDDVIVLRFRDWSNKDLLHGLVHAISDTLGCEIKDLDHKVIVLDGFDEIKLVNKRKKIIHELFNDTLDFDDIKIIITSRPDYLKNVYDFDNVLEILPFDISRIKEFYRIITGTDLDIKDIDCDNLDILGIPVILYMSIMAGIDLTLKTTRAELYNRIFAEKGGIFDRFCFSGIGYDNGLQPLRDIENVRKYFGFLQNVAFSMFEKDELALDNKECYEPELEFQGEKFSVMEFPIRPLFESSENKIEFIHKSIYEYFAAQKISASVYDAINSSREKLAGVLGKLFRTHILSKEMLCFLKYTIESTVLCEKFYEVNEAFQLMISSGMTYYTGLCYENVIQSEICIFTNMLELIHLWEIRCLKYDNSFYDYIKCNKAYGFPLNLKDIYLNKVDLKRDYLNNLYLQKFELNETESIVEEMMGIDLRGADLSKANLMRAVLVGANLKGAVLAEADLRQAILKKADLKEADLKGADLRQADLTRADLNGAVLESSIWLWEDVKKAGLQLYEGKFEYIVVIIGDEEKKISRNSLFRTNVSK